MLIGLDPLLSPELLSVLRAMGHGDEIAIVDGNYPGAEHARRLVRADGHDLPRILDAVLSVLPIDDFVDRAIFRATVKTDLEKRDPVHQDMIDICGRRVPDQVVEPLAPADFYNRVQKAYAVIQSSEPRLYGNIILRKGVIRPGATG
ncbi:RbsD/FucU family protein [Rhizobium alvei]|uniref:RbsD/FucU domain-containing protein n=1 Tax=Rhizobium alvei TaxID=1132659 RepID=A0ABT8YP49_9HYPH|nr:RbsD/FucU domain-containing protein [Rhizobium alvei]MDO6965495.1 RbsD/FucU domain-containing protein [Rhizobium alvei]